jgi:hypothetical protein
MHYQLHLKLRRQILAQVPTLSVRPQVQILLQLHQFVD